MTDDELTKEFIKVLSKADAWALQAAEGLPPIPPSLEDGMEVLVCNIDWDGPHTPVDNWIKVADLPTDADPARILKEIRRALKLKTYFKVCKVCEEKNPVGWMNGYVCHSCLEKSGVVF